MNKFVAFMRDESGASAAEYVLIIAVVGGALIVTLGVFNKALSDAMTSIGATITGAATPATPPAA
jgi:pilus assembly protein Flp/PilA